MLDMDVDFIQSGWSSILMKNVVGYSDLRVFSDFMLFERNNGRVVIYEGGTTQDFILHEWIGDPEDKIGEYLWIGEDSVQGDIIVAFSRRSQQDIMHHIDFYKLIPMPEGNLKVFELGRDMVQAYLRDVQVGSISIVE